MWGGKNNQLSKPHRFLTNQLLYKILSLSMLGDFEKKLNIDFQIKNPDKIFFIIMKADDFERSEHSFLEFCLAAENGGKTKITGDTGVKESVCHKKRRFFRTSLNIYAFQVLI